MEGAASAVVITSARWAEALRSASVTWGQIIELGRISQPRISGKTVAP